MSNKTMIMNAISAVLAMGLTSTSAIAAEDTMHGANIPGMEKCYGIAKAGHNDCGSTGHGCAGESTIDRDKEAWLNVPTGLCNKIAGGSTKPSKG